MKRTISLVLVLILCLALVACGSESATNGSTATTKPSAQNATTTTTEPQTSTKNEGILPLVPTNPDFSANDSGDEETTTTTTKTPATTTATKPTTSTTVNLENSPVRGVINEPRTEKITFYNLDKESYQIVGKQDRIVTYKGTIKVGNTAATSGTNGKAGKYLNDGILSYFNLINFNGGIGGDLATGKQGYYIEFVNYDDQSSSSNALALTKKLVEQDRIFALVGQLGTASVEATVGYIKQQGLISVGAFSNSDKLHLYALNANEGAGIFPVLPVYYVEGQIMVGQLLSQHPDARKIGILYTSDEVGTDVKNGAREIIPFLGGDYEYVVANFSTTTSSIKNAMNAVADCDVLIIAANEQNVANALKGMIDNKVYKPAITPDCASTGAIFTKMYQEYKKLPAENKFPVYSSVWLSPIDVDGYLEFSANVVGYTGTRDTLISSTQSTYHVIYGYIAAEALCTGLQRVASSGKDITVENFIAAMESKNVTVALTNGATLNYQGGGRYGTTTFLLLTSSPNCDTFYYGDEMKDYLAFVVLRDTKYLP